MKFGMKSLTLREKILLAVLALAGFGYLFYEYHLASLLAAYEQLSAEVPQKRAEFQRLEGLVRREKELEAQFLKSEATVKELGLRQDVHPGLVLYDLGQEAQKNGLKINRFSPLNKVDKGGYWEIPVDISVQGSYSAIEYFLQALPAIDPRADIREVWIGPVARPDRIILVTKEELEEGKKGSKDKEKDKEPKSVSSLFPWLTVDWYENGYLKSVQVAPTKAISAPTKGVETLEANFKLVFYRLAPSAGPGEQGTRELENGGNKEPFRPGVSAAPTLQQMLDRLADILKPSASPSAGQAPVEQKWVAEPVPEDLLSPSPQGMEPPASYPW